MTKSIPRRSVEYLIETYHSRKYYRKHRYIGVFEGVIPRLVILDPELARDVLLKHFKHFPISATGQQVSKISF